MKRFFTSILLIAAMVSVTACGNGKSNSNGDVSQNTAKKIAATELATTISKDETSYKNQLVEITGVADKSNYIFLTLKTDCKYSDTINYTLNCDWADKYTTDNFPDVAEQNVIISGTVTRCVANTIYIDKCKLVSSAATIATADETTQTTSAETTKTTIAETADETQIIVYVSSSGKYHTKNDCSGMKTYTEMTLADAKTAGYTACDRCN